MVMIGLLFIQYILSMTSNPFRHIPRQGIRFVGAIVLNRRAFKFRSRRWIIASVTGSVSILVAITCGALFIPSPVDAYSLAMAIAFLAAISSYAFGLYRGRSAG